jgi:hypothetical protein
MTAYFDSLDRVDRLVATANEWIGTLWFANSACKGGGVSCHNLPREIYVECGALPKSFPKIAGDPKGVTANNEMEIFLDGRPEFKRVERADRQPGDLIGLWLPMDSVGRRVKERCVNHLGVVLPGDRFIHVLLHKRTCRDDCNVPPWQQHIVANWRPLDLSTL